jgi:hypothetical protein
MNVLAPEIAANFAAVTYEKNKGRKEKTDYSIAFVTHFKGSLRCHF